MRGPTYTGGKPCKHGHWGRRYLSNHGCVECNTQRTKTASINKAARLLAVLRYALEHYQDLPKAWQANMNSRRRWL